MKRLIAGSILGGALLLSTALSHRPLLQSDQRGGRPARSIAGVAPGAADYHGGAWAVNLVTFSAEVTPYLLTSAAAVQTAAAAGDVSVTRVPTADFRCPVQP